MNHPQLRPFHSHPAQLERAPEQKPEASRERARDSTAQPARHSAEEERFRGRQLRDGPLKQMGEPTPSGEAEQQLQQQQQATLSSKQELQQAAASLQRRSLDRSDSLHDNSAAQPVSAPTEGMQVSPKAEHTTGSANAVASPEQAALPSPTQSLSSIATPRPDLTSTCASDATASSDSIALLQGGQSQPGLGTPEPEPLSRGKRPELEESLSALDASAFHLMSGKPKQQGPPPSSPAAPKDGTTLGQSGKFIAAEALLGKPAGPLGSRAATASAAARRALPPAAAAQLAVEEHAEGAPPESHAQTASQEDGQGATQSKPKQRKRVYRQSSAGAAAAEEEAPEPKRPKPAAPALQQQVQVKPAPSIPAPQPQQQPKEAKPTKVREPIRHPEQPIDLPPSAVQNIYRSIRKLRLQGHGQHSSQLSNQHLDLLNPLPPLVQLRVLSKYASEVLPDGNVVKFFSLTVEAMRSRRDVKWLSQRDETATAYRLCDAAASLYGRLGDCGELPVKSVPTMTPQMVPLELQAAYILCIGGYIGSLSRREFADQLLMGLLGQVCITMHDHKASAADLKTAELNLKAAGASIAKLHQRLKQSSAPGVEPQRAQQATQGSKIGGVVQACFGGLVRLNRLKHGFADDRSMNFLQSQGPLWQLRIVSYFGCHLRRPATNASAFLTTVCRNNRDDRSASKLDWLRCIAGHVHPQTQSLLDQAYRAGILPRDKHIPGKIAALPTDLHFAAACFVVGAQSSDPSCNSKAAAAGPSHHATSAVEDFVRFAQGLIHEADPAAVPDYKRARSESASRSASRGASRAASQPPRNDQGDRTAARRGGQQPGAAAGALPTPADPRARPPSQAPDPQPSSSHQQGSGLRQAHASHTGSSWPRHCRYFYRMDGGCLNRQCDHYHGSHQEYVAYMVHCGLVPYSLKFASDVGRDKWIADAAVDGLNDMIVSQQLPRDSFSEGDLRPLAFLQDPNGDPARMQLQVGLLHDSFFCCRLT